VSSDDKGTDLGEEGACINGGTEEECEDDDEMGGTKDELSSDAAIAVDAAFAFCSICSKSRSIELDAIAEVVGVLGNIATVMVVMVRPRRKAITSFKKLISFKLD
jgi:hypothetical protein